MTSTSVGYTDQIKQLYADPIGKRTDFLKDLLAQNKNTADALTAHDVRLALPAFNLGVVGDNILYNQEASFSNLYRGLGFFKRDIAQNTLEPSKAELKEFVALMSQVNPNDGKGQHQFTKQELKDYLSAVQPAKDILEDLKLPEAPKLRPFKPSSTRANPGGMFNEYHRPLYWYEHGPGWGFNSLQPSTVPDPLRHWVSSANPA